MRIRYGISVIAAAAVFTLVGCSDSTGPMLSADEKVVVEPDEAAVALLPADIRSAGVLTVGVDPYYGPNEYKDETGKTIGWAVDLGDAIAQKLDLELEYKESAFDAILPGVVDGTFDIGFSSFTDNAERQELVDFVNYFDAGIQWAQIVGGNVDPANACGLTVAVQFGTYEQTDVLPAKSEACVAAGQEPITILAFETQDEATTTLVLGRADAMTADSPITLHAVSLIKDQIEVAGEAFDVAPYGIAVGKDSKGLDKAIQAALQSLVADGNYKKVLEGWAVAAGSRADITINAGG